MPRISIVIPVYNSSRFLEECLRSVLRQDFTDWHVILVDDGSTDGSGTICDQYAATDPRIEVLHQPNQGLSVARNNGLARAQGEFVLFLDSDDFWLRHNTLTTLLDAMDRHPECDFIGFNWVYYFSKEKQRRRRDFGNYVPEVVSGEEALRSILRSGDTPMSACIKIIRRDFIIESKLSFIPGITSEDIPWFMRLLCHAKGCLFLHDYLYGYRQEVDGSITREYSPRRFRDLVFIIEDGLRLADSQPSQGMREALLSFYATEYCILLSHMNVLTKEERQSMEPWMRKHQYLLRCDQSPKVRLAHRAWRLTGLRGLELLLRLRNMLVRQ